MKICITGSLGFIATNLIIALSQDSRHNLIGIDNKCSGSSNLSYTSHLCEHHFIDLIDKAELISLLEDVDIVIHLAAQGNVVDSIVDPLSNFNSNVLSTVNLLDAMRLSGVRKIVFASTGGAIMGNSSPPVNEQSLPSPISPYGASKLACEAYLSAYSCSFSFACVALRFGNVYGPFSMHKSGVINKWIAAALDSKHLTIYGDGSSSRDYIHVSDLVDGIISAISYSFNLNSTFSKFHLANSREITLNSLLSLIEEVHGSPLDVLYKQERRGEVERNFADTGLARSTLNFSPRVGFRVGIEQLYHWISAQRTK